MIYLVILLLLLYGSLRYDFKEQPLTTKNRFYIFVIGLMLFIACFAYNLGADTVGYLRNWESWPTLFEINPSYHLTSDFSRFQPGWVLFQSFFRTITTDFLWFQFFHNLIVGLIVYYFIRRHTNNVFFATLMFFLVNYLEFNFEIMRESLAVASCLLAIDMLGKKKYLWMVVFSLIAFSFHASAVVVPIILLLSWIKYSRKGEIICIVVCLVFPVVMFYVYDQYGLAVFELLSDGENLENLYTLEEHSMSIFGYGAIIIRYLLLPMLATFFIKDENQKKYIFLAYLYALLRMSTMFSYGLYRLGNYCSIFYFITVGNLLYCLINNMKFEKIIVVLVFVTFIMWVFDYYLLGYDTVNAHYMHTRYFPYEWVLTPGNSY